MALIINPLSLKNNSVGEDISAIAVLHVIHVVTCIYLSISPFICAFAVLLPVQPIPLVYTFVFSSVDTEACHSIVLPLTIIIHAIGP
jgi:hypothetical protein